MISFIVQARVGSSRLPNKILLPFYDNNSLLDLLIFKLKQIEGTRVVIATSKASNCDVIESFAKKNDICCFRGSELDVLQRYIDAAELFGSKKIIRICSDNPFLELDSLVRLKNEALKQIGYDYISYNINGIPSIKTHYGFWAEYVSLEALYRVKQLTKDTLYHEHVTNFIYSHPEHFKIGWLEGPKSLSNHKDIRLTIDTKEDFVNAQTIYSDLCKKNPFPTIDSVVEYLDEHDCFYSAMKQQIKNNSK